MPRNPGQGSKSYMIPMTPSNLIDKCTWIEISSKPIKYQTADIEKDGGLILGDIDGPSWFYLLPEQIQETINNSWEPWETVSSRLAGTLGSAKGMLAEVSAIYASAKNALDKGITIRSIERFGKGTENVANPNFKVDTPLVYSNTNRTEWNLEFNLYATSKENVTEMMEGIKVMKYLSMPVLKKDSIGSPIELPYAFKLKSSPESDEDSIIKTGWCALTSFQPTYKAPYDDFGRPMNVVLTVTFTELAPKYAPDSSELGGIDWKLLDDM